MQSPLEIDQLVPLVFKRPAPAPFEFELTLEDEDGAFSDHDVFRALGQILTHGLVYLFGEDVDLSQLSRNEIDHIQACMAGLGYRVLIEPTPEQQQAPHVIPYFLKLPCPAGQSDHYINIAFQTLIQ